MKHQRIVRRGLYASLLGTLLCSPSVMAENSSDMHAFWSVTQSSEAKGKIVDDKTGETLIGVNVLIKGTSVGTVSDVDGNFRLPNVKPGDVLQVSFVGYKTTEVKVPTDGKPLTIRLQTDDQLLDEVVVVGYSTQKKESLTGSMQSIKENKLRDITTPNVSNMLNGKISGVYVAPGSSQPGAEGGVVIRGKASLSGTSAPLWVIDGVIVGSSAGALNPSDIETMTILKDAASTAIYGSQGANGVILVTTKSSKSGKMRVNFSGRAGVSTLNNGNMEVMDGAELYDYYKSFNNVEQIKFSRWNEDLSNSNFDWWKAATQVGFNQDYNLSLSGGNESLNSFFSMGYYSEEGAVKGYNYDRYNFRYKSNFKPASWLTIKPQIAGSLKKVHDAQYSVAAMYSMLPWDSPYDKDGNLVPHRYQGWVNAQQTNYLLDLDYGDSSDSNTYEFMGNFDFDIRLTDWLTFSSVNNYKWLGIYQKNYEDPRSSSAEGVNGRISQSESYMARRYTNQILRFNKLFGKHALNGLVAYEFNDYRRENTDANGTGFIPGMKVLKVTALPEKVGGGISEWAVQSYLFNANYAYDNKYLAQLSLRRDGASNFGENDKYGNFFSISAGWNINREKWFKADWVDVLKLRVAYGSVGNRPSELYPQYDLYAVSTKYNTVSGALISQIGNPELTWEKTYTTGIGLDANFFNDRLRLVVDLYDKFTSNILYKVPVSGLTGVTSRWKNVGEMLNRGIELTIGGDIIRTKDVTWSAELNLAHNENKIQKLYGDNPDLQIIVGDVNIAGAGDKILKPGYSSDTFYLREWAGVNKDTGAPQWYKTVKNPDGTTSRVITEKYAEADQVIGKHSTPDLFGGFNTSLTWKNFEVNTSFGFAVGGYIYNYARQEYDSDGTYTDRNQIKLRPGWSRWQSPGDIATHPVASYNNSSNSAKASSRFLEDAGFLKMRTLSLAYNFSIPKWKLNDIRLSLTAENLFCITNYSGVDPELPYDADGGKVIGTASPSVYPSTRKFILGLNFSF